MGANQTVLLYFPPLQGSRFPWCNNSFKTLREELWVSPPVSQGWLAPNLPLLLPPSSCRASVFPSPPYLAGGL